MGRTRIWTTIKCASCSGYGVAWGGLDDGPVECPDCAGSGAQWMTSQGRIALYPGGPFRGSLPSTNLTEVADAR